mgnify:CR=1 FL=1
MSRISLQMYTMREFTKTKEDLKNTVEKLSKIGFKNLQYSVPDFISAREVKEIFDDYGIKNDSIFCPALKIEEKINDIFEQSEIFGTKYLRVDSIPRDIVSPAGFKMYAHYLNELGELLAPMEIKILYHFHSFEFITFEKETGMDIFLKETNPETVYIQPDTYWLIAGGNNPPDYLIKHKDRIHYVHVKDYAIGIREQLLESTPSRFAAVGTGNLDWKKIIEACESFHNEMYVIEQDNCYGKDPFECVATSFKNLNKFGIY